MTRTRQPFFEGALAKLFNKAQQSICARFHTNASQQSRYLKISQAVSAQVELDNAVFWIETDHSQVDLSVRE